MAHLLLGKNSLHGKRGEGDIRSRFPVSSCKDMQKDDIMLYSVCNIALYIRTRDMGRREFVEEEIGDLWNFIFLSPLM
jgi:hypothetical protein